MAFFSIAHVSLKGISAAVPQQRVSNFDLEHTDKEDLHKLISTLGIEERRVSTPAQCASDLCVAAAEKLLSELSWDKSEIDAVFFVTQTPDYQLPGTSLHIQERLGLPKSCATFDINQGCAGYVYGLSLASAFLSSSGLKKALLLVGDTITKLISPFDQSLLPLFSDCGTASALEFDTKAEPLFFNITSEGENFDKIMVSDGGARNGFSEASLVYKEYHPTVKRMGTHLAMKGLDVFNFSLKKVAPNVEELLEKAKRERSTIDYFVFHQANQMILDSIAKKLGIDPAKVPSSLKAFGNTSSTTVPLTIVANLNTGNRIADSSMLLSGFGVGLSLASALVNFKGVVCPDIIELS